MNAALHFSVTCSEDAPRVTAQEVTEALSHTRVADLARRTLSVCDAWPRGHVPADFATPVTSDVPALLLSGGLDPVTPPKDAAEVARTLGHSRQVVAAGFGHIVSPHACAPQLVAAFVDRAGFDTLPAECITFLEQTKRPPFFVDRLVAKP
jgi:pimeloyl-ACP methyl ester carboxylesterase